MTDAQDRPIPSAKVDLYSENELVYSGSANEEGLYQFTELAKGRYRVEGRLPTAEPGRTYRACREVDVEEGDNESVSLALPVGGTASISGRVVDLQDRGLRDIEVSIQHFSEEESDPSFCWLGELVLETVSDGGFEFSGLVAGCYQITTRIEIENKSFGNFKKIDLSEGEHKTLSLMVPIGGAASLSGRVVDLQGHGIHEAEVELGHILDDRDKGTFRSNIETGKEGEFEFTGLAEGCYLLESTFYDSQGSDRSRFRDQKSLIFSEGEHQTVTLTLPVGGTASISGRVVDSKGQGIAGVSVTCSMRSLGLGWLRSATKEGEFNFNGLPAGKYHITCSQDEGFDVSKDLVLSEGEHQTVTLILPVQGTASISGQVFDFPGLSKVCLTVCLSFREWTRTVSYTENKFEFAKLPEGHYRIEIDGVPTQEIDLLEGEHKTLTLTRERRATTLRGTLTTEEGPLAGAKICVSWKFPLSFEEASTGADGFFLLGNLREGEAEIEIYPDRKNPTPYLHKDVLFLSGTVEYSPLLRLADRRSLHVIVKTPRGDPVEDLDVGLYSNGDREVQISGSTDSNGIIQFDLLLPGDYLLKAEGWSRYSKESLFPPTPIHLTESTTIELRVKK